MFLKCINVYFSSAVFVIETLIKNLNEATVLSTYFREGRNFYNKEKICRKIWRDNSNPVFSFFKSDVNCIFTPK